MNALNKYLLRSTVVALAMVTSICQAANDYMVIDLSSGASATNYPVTYYAADSLDVTNDIYKTDKMLLKKLSAGTFTMGSPASEDGRAQNEDLLAITLDQDFYIGVFEVTEQQWSNVAAGSVTNPKKAKGYIGVGTIQSGFLAGLNPNLDLGTMQAELPVETQWEYACRAGTTNAYSFGDNVADLGDYAWYDANGGSATYDVGLKLPNSWGLYDMHGNASESCYGLSAHPHSATYIYKGAGTGTSRLASYCRSAFRRESPPPDPPSQPDPQLNNSRIGFRIVIALPSLYDLTVVNGSGSGTYTNNHIQQVIADAPPAWYEFDQWSGDDVSVGDTTAPTTTVTIAAADVNISAIYKPLLFDIEVINGTGSDIIATNGQVVTISADQPVATNIFYYWDGSTNSVADISAATTTVTVAGADISLTAIYRHTPYLLTVTNGVNLSTSSHFAGEVVAIQATPPTSVQDFLWIGDTATITDLEAWDTTLVMPAMDIGISASYPDKKFTLTVINGYGGGSYTNGTTVNVSATAPTTSLHSFDNWTGDVSSLASTNDSSTVFTMSASDATITARYKPALAVKGKYMVVNLLSSVDAYEITYLDAPPVDGWDTHKTGKMAFKRIMPGSFQMGANDSGLEWYEDEHTVKLTEAFYIGIFEVTQGQWYNVMSTYPSIYAGTEHPVENVSYDLIRGASEGREWPATVDVNTNSFVGKMRLKGSSDGFDLPTEAQWEYACRAGTTGGWYVDTSAVFDVAVVSVFGQTALSNPAEVGRKLPNSWGLYDSHGNVTEWCLDWFTGFGLGTGDQTDPVGPLYPNEYPDPYIDQRVIRGGSYDKLASPYSKSGYRNGRHTAIGADAHTGFRMIKAVGLPNQLTLADSKVNTTGIYYYRAQIAISAVDKTGQGFTFDYWEVLPADVYPGSRFDAANPDTIISMPNHELTVTARYK